MLRQWIHSSTEAAWLIAGMAALTLLCPRDSSAADAAEPTAEAIRETVTKSIRLVESSTAQYRGERECFSCHHQALPVLMLSEARRRGFDIDAENLKQQLEHTAAHLERGRESYLGGRGQGGKADTAGWALWTLETGDQPPDETTAAVTGFLLSWQGEMDHWGPASQRPPTEASEFTSTYVAIRGLRAFGTPEQQERIGARIEKAKAWVLTAPTKETEDRVFRLRALSYLGAETQAIEPAAAELLGGQRADGGWSQTAEMASDAYATGTVLTALHEAGRLETTDPRYLRGLRFLIDHQLDDGSWQVPTRSEPIQLYFESGFPHGNDQFISIAASSWATMALLFACPVPSETE